MKEEAVAEADHGDFARSVVKLFRWNTAVEANRAPFQGDASLDVRRCANGLALMRQMLDAYMRQNTLTGTDIAATGIAEAYGILDHLTSGRAHPISKHIKGIHSAAFRPQHAPANDFEQLVQRIVVGAMRAVQASTHSGVRASARAIADELCRCGSEYQPTEGAIRGWHLRFAKAVDPGPDAYAGEIAERARKSGDAPLVEGVRLIVQHTLVASPV